MSGKKLGAVLTQHSTTHPAAPQPPQSILTRVVQKAYRNRRRFATGAAFVLAALIGYHVLLGANGVVAYATKRHETAHLQKQIDELQKQNDKLTARVNRLQNDPATIEEAARQHLHYAKPGEIIVTVPAAPAANAPAPAK
jgi:cell division protein FtsB